MEISIGWVEENLNHSNSVSIFTDIQSLCIPLLGTSIAIDKPFPKLEISPTWGDFAYRGRGGFSLKKCLKEVIVKKVWETLP